MKNYPLPYHMIKTLDKNTIKYLLLESNYNLRKKEGHNNFGKNVSSTIFTCKGYDNFGPVSEISTKSEKTETNNNYHSERKSLLKAINEAIDKKWGPFAALTTISTDHLSIDAIKSNQDLLTALQQLDEIHIFTERKPCDFEDNKAFEDSDDKGCAVYLKDLNLSLKNDKINVYSHFQGNLNNNIAVYALKEEFYNLDFYFELDELILKLKNTQNQIHDYNRNKDLIFSEKDAYALNALEKELAAIQNEANLLNRDLNPYKERHIKIEKEIEIEREKNLPENPYNEHSSHIISKYKIFDISADISKKIKNQTNILLLLEQTGMHTLQMETPQQKLFEDVINKLYSKLKATQQEIAELEKLPYDEPQQKTTPFKKIPSPIQDQIKDKLPESLFNEKKQVISALEDLLNDNSFSSRLFKLKSSIQEILNTIAVQDSSLPNNYEGFIIIIKREITEQENKTNALERQVGIYQEIKQLTLMADEIQEKINNLSKLQFDDHIPIQALGLKFSIQEIRERKIYIENLLVQNRTNSNLFISNKNSMALTTSMINKQIEIIPKLATQIKFYENIKDFNFKLNKMKNEINESSSLPYNNSPPAAILQLERDILEISNQIKKANDISREIQIDSNFSHGNKELIAQQMEEIQKLDQQTKIYRQINELFPMLEKTKQQITELSRIANNNDSFSTKLSEIEEHVTDIKLKKNRLSSIFHEYLTWPKFSSLSDINKKAINDISRLINQQNKEIQKLKQPTKILQDPNQTNSSPAQQSMEPEWLLITTRLKQELDALFPKKTNSSSRQEPLSQKELNSPSKQGSDPLPQKKLNSPSQPKSNSSSQKGIDSPPSSEGTATKRPKL